MFCNQKNILRVGMDNIIISNSYIFFVYKPKYQDVLSYGCLQLTIWHIHSSFFKFSKFYKLFESSQ
jgi:hypothetical protein